MGDIRFGILLAWIATFGCHAGCPADFANWADVIVVGCGTAGSVVVGRLAEAGANVLVLEEGYDYAYRRDQIDIPRYVFDLWESPDITRSIPAMRGSNEFLADSRRAGLRGVGPGGTSNINGGLWSRPELKEFDEWSVPGWMGKDVLPFFQKVENYQGPDRSGFHGKNGKIYVGLGEVQKYARDWLSDAKRGYPEIETNEDGETHGALTLAYRAIKRGVRQDSFKAYVNPLGNRPNLCIITQANVTKILAEKGPSGKRHAMGVVFVQKGDNDNPIQVNAKKEIVISAGVYGTAKILLLSGIGPREHLEEMGIPVLIDLPVASSFISRPASFVIMSGTGVFVNKVRADYMTHDILNRSTEVGQKAFEQWQRDGSGGLSIGPASVLGTPIWKKGGKFPNYMIQFTDALPSTFPADFTKQCKPLYFFPMPSGVSQPPAGANMGVCVLIAPKSRSEIKLQSSNPLDPIIYSPRFFEDERDITDMVGCLEKLRGRTGADVTAPSGIYGVSLQVLYYGISDFNPYRGIEVFPGYHARADLDEYVKKCSSSAYHVFGSTRIGTDPGNSVVDPQLIVHGFENLRIADAGVLIGVSSGPGTSTFMVGERCAHFIKAKYGYQHATSHDDL